MKYLKAILLVWFITGSVSNGYTQGLPEFHYTIENMRVINSRFSELSITPLNDTVYMLVSDRGGKDKYNKWIGGVPYDIFYVNRRDWNEIYDPVGLNTKFSDGPATIKAPGELYVTQTNLRGQVDSKSGAFIYRLNISKANWDGERWHLEEIKGFKHKEHSYAHPTITDNGNTLYYVSDRPEGLGGKDIYVSCKTGDSWSEPENLGEAVNSNRDESFPFYHPSGRLYFCSNRKDGVGGIDIYYTRKIGGTWQTPENLGAPINTKANDYAIYFDENMERGFFSSNRLGGRGGEDVFSIYVDKLFEEPEPVIAAVDLQEQVEVSETIDLQITPPVNPDVTETILLENNEDLILLNRSMQEEGLRNVYFSMGSHAIDSEGAAVMDRMAVLLERYEDPVIELHAYADATGSYEENILLTEKRARSVMQYLIGKGVPVDRMNYKAYGESSLYIEQDEDVRLNRRVEFRLKLYDHNADRTETDSDWLGFAIREMIVLEPEKFYVQLAALGPNSMFNGYKLKKYGTTVCYFQKGMYKYVLGPFNTLDEAKDNLRSVRSDYRDAFIFKNY
ncbi:MAG: OmpA family protein [Bacteroidetes bacterium]|nr:OmpA family protein [Bacteroidota bacterium]